MKRPIKTAFLHYTAPPVIGGVEAVMSAHAKTFCAARYPVKIVCGGGEKSAFPPGVELEIISEMASLHPEILTINENLEHGEVPPGFEPIKQRLKEALRPALADCGVWIVHNIFSKHFNLPLTAALAELVEENPAVTCLGWCHDFTWTSANSRSKVFPGFPWDLIRLPLPGVQYVTISNRRWQEFLELAEQSGDPSAVAEARETTVIPSGVDPVEWFGLSPTAVELVERLDLLSGNPVLLMPVRITRAKNIELAVQVTAALKAFGRDPRLVVTGPPDPHSNSAMEYYRSLLDNRSRLGLEKEVGFVYETGENSEDRTILVEDVAGLMRAADVMFMPSHREGFGMPVIEAGLLGIPVVCSSGVPAAEEIGGENVLRFESQDAPEDIARLIANSVLDTRWYRLRHKIRAELSWNQVFRQKIAPFLIATRHA